MGRPRIKMNLKLVHRLRIAGLGWRIIARRFYSQTKQDINWMTLSRRYMGEELDLAQEQRGNNDR